VNGGIWLRLEGQDVVVLVEARAGVWVEVIRERADGCYSHIVEPGTIERLCCTSTATGRP
jgi:hypothetical protein